MANSDDIDVAEMIEDGYGYDDINEAMYDAGYDKEDVAEAWADAGYDWQDALGDALRDNVMSEQEFREDAAWYADMLDLSIHDAYDLYYGYGDE